MKLKLRGFIPKNYIIENYSIPIRTWKKDYPIPTKLKLFRSKIKTTTSYNTKTEIIRYCLLGEVKKEFKKNKFKYIKLKNKIFIKIISKCNNLNLNNRKLIFDGKYLRIVLKNNEMGIWSFKRTIISFTILPKIITLNFDFFELIGILDGEMNRKIRKDRNGQTVKISNSEPIIIKHIVNTFEKYFLINRKLIRGSITFNSKCMQINKEEDNNYKKIWSKLINIPLENFSKSTMNTKYMSKKSPIGVLQIRYENSMLFNILMNIIKNIRKITLSHKNYTTAYLRGLSAAEGGIGKVYNRKTEGLRLVFISSMNKKDKLFYMKCLKNINITSYNEYPLRVEIYGKNNFLKLYNFDLFKYHPERKRNFIKHLKKSYPFITDSGTNLTTLEAIPT